MPSQQLPKSSKFETLPPDLKKIAESLIREKFGIKHEPEVMDKPRGDLPPRNATYYGEPLEGKFVQVEFYSLHHSYREGMSVDLTRGTEGVERMLVQRCKDLERRYGPPFGFRVRQNGPSVREPLYPRSYW